MSERVILHLDMNAFFASVEQRSDPRLRGQPVLVCGNRNARTVVATASYEARAFGVKTGMSLPEALALCPQAVLVEGNPAKYADTFRRIARLMERYSPELEIFSIDEAFLDLSATAERFAGGLAIAKALQRQVHQDVGLPCSVGVGPNKLMAKLASSLKKPNGITEIRREEVPKVLAALPIEALCGIGPRFQAALNAQGIMTCGALTAVPLDRLTRQFGPCAGRHLFRLARGQDASPVVPMWRVPAAHCGRHSAATPMVAAPPAAKSMGHLQTLAHDVDRPSVMRAVLLGLSEKVGRRLRAEGACGRTVTVTVRFKDFTTLTRSRTLEVFLEDGYDIYQSGWRILETVLLPQQRLQPVRLLGISISGLSYGARQSWWLPDMVQQRALLDAHDRINNRFGERTLRRASLLAEPEVDRHYQLKRYGGAAVAAAQARPL